MSARLTWLGQSPFDVFEQLKYGNVRHWVLWYSVKGRRSVPNAPLLTTTVWRYGGVLNNVTIAEAKTLARRQLSLRAGASFPEPSCSDCRIIGVGLSPLGEHGPVAWTEMATTRLRFIPTVFG